MTKIVVSCVSADDTEAVISIDSGWLSSDWKPGDETQWGDPGGAVSGWGQPDTFLQGPGGPHAIILEGFNKETPVGKTGTGSKNYVDGTFPEGGFEWKVTSRT